MKKLFEALYHHQLLDYTDAKDILMRIAQGDFNPSQIASFLTVFMMRGVTVQELSGFRDALMELCLPITFGGIETIDLCGTGGDEKNTFNISTLASFVVAGAGLHVTKHGNYGVSSVSGSSNLLEHLGYRFKNDQQALEKELIATGICFMHAPLFHPAMKTVAPIRKELGVKTFFNMLGPMVNPSRPSHQMVGVFNMELARMYHYIFQQSGIKYSIIYGLDGYDECSLTSGTRLLTDQGELLVEPEDFGLNRLHFSEISGGENIKRNASIFMNVLENKGSSAHQQVVIANAALALQCTFDEPLTTSVARASESLSSGKALQVFKKLISLQ
jgi:anthranilate phosphoribosyltransferase